MFSIPLSFTKYFALGTILILSSCSLLVGGSIEYQKNETYSFNIDNHIWAKAPKDSSDYAFINDRTGSHIVINSLCKKYERTSLEQLSINLLSGIANLKLDSQVVEQKYSRMAKESVGSGTMDGVPFRFQVLTFKRDRCTFDFALLSTQENFSTEEVVSFQNLLNSLRFNQ